MRKSLLRRRAFTLIEMLVVIAVIAVLIALLVPAVMKVRYMAAQTQSTNNLKQCALAAHAYHDAWKFLPFNGVASATSADYTSGSWAYQILPYLDQQPLYDSQPANTDMADPVPALLCAIRGRPGYYGGTTSNAVFGTLQKYTFVWYTNPINGVGAIGTLISTTPIAVDPSYTFTRPNDTGYYYLFTFNAPVTVVFIFDYGNGPPTVGPIFYGLTSEYIFGVDPYLPSPALSVIFSVPTAPNSGPATDFGINVFLNDATGGINSPNVNRQLATISDGASNTILMGHAYVQTSVYPSTTAVPSALQSIFNAGSLATGRNSLGNNAATWLPDGIATTANQWGSPMPGGGLMAMADGAVRMFPYATPLTNFLLPDDGNPVELPD